jgi:hypothetical protein
MQRVYRVHEIFVFGLSSQMADHSSRAKPERIHMLHMHRSIRDRLRRRPNRGAATEVHFHQGPQGQPTPCFDERCPNPRLSV